MALLPLTALTFLLWFTVTLIKGSPSPCILREVKYGKVCVCNSTYCDTIERVPKIPQGQFVVFISSEQGQRFFKMQMPFSDVPYVKSKKGSNRFIVNNTAVYQNVMGFGGAITDSSTINLGLMDTKTQNQILKQYFSKHGIEYSVLRVPIGGTDFSLHAYTYDDGDPDPDLKNFKLADEDIKYKIPLIKKAKRISSRDISLIAASWSPPLWMKTRQAFTGYSFLQREHYDTYVQYLLRFLDEYHKHGLDVWALSTGNEPSNGLNPWNYVNSLGWWPWSLSNWIAQHLGPQLQNSVHNNTKLVAFDDQRLFLPWWINWMTHHDKDILNYIDGFSVHWYWDFVIGDGVIKDMYKKYPGKFILYTEASAGYIPLFERVQFGSWVRGAKYLKSIIQNLNSGVIGWMDWNILLDMSGGPTYVGNNVDCPILVNPEENEFYKQPMFYALAHVSKFIEPGALRIDISPEEISHVYGTAVQNPDGRIVLVLLNKNKDDTDLAINIPEKGWINLEIPGNSFITILC